MVKVEPYRQEDLIWIEKIFNQHRKLLGNFFWMKGALKKSNQKMVVIREKGFCRYRFDKKKNGWVIEELAVDENSQRDGIGKLLLNSIPLPLYLKTDTDNVKSNAFYKKNGFILLGVSSGKKKQFNNWVKF